MNERDQLIRSIRKAITALKKRRESPNTSSEERAQLTAKIAELEAQLALLTGQEIADAAAVVALDDETAARMFDVARDLDQAVSAKRRTAAIVDLINAGFAVLAT